MLTILFDGVAYGMVLFTLSCGLAVTLGLMNFINLAHGAFAMAGGYFAFLLATRYGVSFFATIPLVFILTAALGLVIERTLYSHLYGSSHLEQVLLTVGLVFMSIVIADYFMGSQPVSIPLPEILRGQIEVGGVGLGRYRLFLILVCGLLTLAVQLVISCSRFGRQLRAAVDNASVARGVGIRVNRLFALTFAFGCGLAGIGGALGAEIMNIEPTFPFKYMIYFLVIVAVGGTTSLTGPFLAAMLLGIADVAGKYYAPSIGTFTIYVLMIATLLVRPNGLLARRT